MPLGIARIDDAPASLAAESPGALTVVADSSGPTLTVDPATYNTSADGWVIMATGQRNSGRAWIGSALRILKVGTGILAAPQSFLTEYQNKFGALAPGRSLGVAMFYTDKTTGTIGTRTQELAIVT